MPSAAILAGGRARRFGGRDKSALLVGGQPIVERQIEQLAQMTNDIMVVGHEPNYLSSRGRQMRVRHVPDRVKGCGPLGGLDAALASAREELVVVVACDMPFVTAGFLNYLASLAGATGNAAPVDAVVPRTSDRYHPLCAVYARACRSAIDARLAARQLSMAGLLEGLRVRVVREHEMERFGRPGALLANVNTPDEFDELAAATGHEP